MIEPANRLEALQRQLARRFPRVPEEAVFDTVAKEWSAFEAAPVQTFVPVLVERRVSEAVRTGKLPVSS